MVLGKNITIYGKLADQTRGYSVVVERKRESQDGVLFFESGIAAALNATEFDGMRKDYQSLLQAYALLGVLPYQPAARPNINLLYLLVVTQCSSVGKLPYGGAGGECEIFRINQVQAVPLWTHILDQTHVQDVINLFPLNVFYFAVPNNIVPGGGGNLVIDLTLSTQKLARLDRQHGPVDSDNKRRTNSDNRFFWNRMLWIYLLRFGIAADKWLVKIICGCVEIKTIYAGHQQARACLISRYSTWRAGTRFQTRGVDEDGFVANFVETEQIIYANDKVAAFVQIRGSIPLHWQQSGVQVGAHRITFSRPMECMEFAFEKHFSMLKREYGEVAIVNLLGIKEGEIFLTQRFEHQLQQNSRLRGMPYISFDFHSQCRSGNIDNLAVLKSQLDIFLQTCGLFVDSLPSSTTNDHGDAEQQLSLLDLSSSNTDNDNNAAEKNNHTDAAAARPSHATTAPVSQQTGVVRSNCLDCLDRTNCTQAYLALEMLAQQMQVVELDTAGKTQIMLRFRQTLEQMWINNGDLISRFYAGTGALSGGKSKLQDASRSVTRTFQNNLLDTTKREAMEILLDGDKRFHEIAERAHTILPTGGYSLLPVFMLTELVGNAVHFTHQQPLRVFCGTWNVNGGNYAVSELYRDNHTLASWLIQAPKASKAANVNYLVDDADFSSPPDVFAVGFEEIVDLNASNIVSASTENQRLWADQLRKILTDGIDEHYILVHAEQLVGVCLFVFLLPKHVPHLREMSFGQAKTGFGGATGNKGGVAIRFVLYNTSLCFVCSHFAAGQSNAPERNADFTEIARRLTFAPGAQTIDSHDYVFWCGDFNYRIDMSSDAVRRFIQNSDWARLLEGDQLLFNKQNGQVFVGYEEAPVCFAPTYKYDFNMDVYDTSEKCRIPAWTDRVLIRTRQMEAYSRFNTQQENIMPTEAEAEDGSLKEWNRAQIVFYGRSELRTSDHRPVAAVIDLQTREVDLPAFHDVRRRVMQELGPPDATVAVTIVDAVTGQPCTQCTLYDADVYNEAMGILAAVDHIVFIRYDAHARCLVTYNNTKSALYAVHAPYRGAQLSSWRGGGEEQPVLMIELHLADWQEWLDAIEHLCLYSSVPLVDAGTARRASADAIWNKKKVEELHQPMLPPLTQQQQQQSKPQPPTKSFGSLVNKPMPQHAPPSLPPPDAPLPDLPIETTVENVQVLKSAPPPSTLPPSVPPPPPLHAPPPVHAPPMTMMAAAAPGNVRAPPTGPPPQRPPSMAPPPLPTTAVAAAATVVSTSNGPPPIRPPPPKRPPPPTFAPR